MEKFSLEKYLANPSRKVVIGDGSAVRIICTDVRNDKYPILALVSCGDGHETAVLYTEQGTTFDDKPDEYDLFFVPKKQEKWVNVYRSDSEGYILGGNIYDSKESAEACSSPRSIATCKIEWEE